MEESRAPSFFQIGAFPGLPFLKDDRFLKSTYIFSFVVSPYFLRRVYETSRHRE